MKLEEIHIQNLKLIKTSKGECLLSTDFISKTSYPEKHKTEVISDLLKLDLIEIEKDANIYFLTPEGYDIAEYGWNHISIQPDLYEEEEGEIIVDYNDLDKTSTTKGTFKVLFLLAGIYTVSAAYKNYFGVKDEAEFKIHLTKDQLKMMKMDIKVSDSILIDYGLFKTINQEQIESVDD